MALCDLIFVNFKIIVKKNISRNPTLQPNHRKNGRKTRVERVEAMKIYLLIEISLEHRRETQSLKLVEISCLTYF